MSDSDKKINKNYTIYSYHKFIELCEKKKIGIKKYFINIKVQNIVSESSNFYKI